MNINRTRLIQAFYILISISAIFGGAWLFSLFFNANSSPWIIFAIPLLLLIPGRVTGYFWKDLLTGRRLADLKKHREALESFQKFQNKLEKRPWLKYLILLSPTTYTISAMALAYNNIGCCYLELGDLKKARSAFENALREDKKYSIAHFNLAIIEQLNKNPSQSNYHQMQALELGFSGSTTDQVILKAQSLYAKYEIAAK